MRYEKWRELAPLNAEQRNTLMTGAKCVVLSDSDGVFENGEAVTVIDTVEMKCVNENGVCGCMFHRELALLPSDTAEPAKQERKIVQIATDRDGVTALCNDGTVWYALPCNAIIEWAQLPPIPQDAV